MQLGKTRRHLAVDLAEHHGAAIGVDDLARLQPIRAEVHEGPDGALSAEDACDDPLAKPVLEREHITVACEVRLQRQACCLGVVGLHGKEDPLPCALDL